MAVEITINAHKLYRVAGGKRSVLVSYPAIVNGIAIDAIMCRGSDVWFRREVPSISGWIIVPKTSDVKLQD